MSWAPGTCARSYSSGWRTSISGTVVGPSRASSSMSISGTGMVRRLSAGLEVAGLVGIGQRPDVDGDESHLFDGPMHRPLTAGEHLGEHRCDRRTKRDRQRPPPTVDDGNGGDGGG